MVGSSLELQGIQAAQMSPRVTQPIQKVFGFAELKHRKCRPKFPRYWNGLLLLHPGTQVATARHRIVLPTGKLYRCFAKNGHREYAKVSDSEACRDRNRVSRKEEYLNAKVQGLFRLT
jgi:hypothetical protein